jgi:hypothetical protein
MECKGTRKVDEAVAAEAVVNVYQAAVNVYEARCMRCVSTPIRLLPTCIRCLSTRIRHALPLASVFHLPVRIHTSCLSARNYMCVCMCVCVCV